MRRREMRRGQRERSGNWRAGCLKTSTSGSEEGGWKRAARAVPRQPPILLGTSVQKKTDLAYPIALFPLARNSMEGQRDSIHLAVWERKSPSGKKYRCLLAGY